MEIKLSFSEEDLSVLNFLSTLSLSLWLSIIFIGG